MTQINLRLSLLLPMVTVPFWQSISAVLDIETRIGIRTYVDYLLVFGNLVILLTAFYGYRKTKNKVTLAIALLGLLMLLGYVGISLMSLDLFG